MVRVPIDKIALLGTFGMHKRRQGVSPPGRRLRLRAGKTVALVFDHSVERAQSMLAFTFVTAYKLAKVANATLDTRGFSSFVASTTAPIFTG
jgi:hypothetical protein